MEDKRNRNGQRLDDSGPGFRALFCVLLVLVLAAVPTIIRAQTTHGNYTVDSEETWGVSGSPYIIQGYLRVASGGHLILDPGVEVRIKSAQVFEVRNGGTLTAEGTDAEPITITAISGQFIGLRLWSGGHTRLMYCDISLAGSGNTPAVDIQATDVSVGHCTIHDNGGRGVQIAGAGLSPTLSNTTIRNNVAQAVYQSTLDMTPTYISLTLSGNGTDAVVINSPTLNRAATLDGAQLNGKPFIALDSVNVNSGGHLTLAAGTEFLIPGARGLYVQSGGMLTTNGTQVAPVTITAHDPGFPFVTVRFLPGSVGRMNHCDIQHAGASGYPAVEIDSSDVILDHCSIHDNGVGSGAALKLVGTGLSPSILNTAIENNTGYAIHQSHIDMVPLYQNLTISGNGIDAVAWSNGYLYRAVTLDGPQIDSRPFISTQTINVMDGGHLVLNPDTKLQMNTGTGLWVQSGGTMTAAGTSSAPAVLTVLDPMASFIKLDFLPGSTGSLTHFELSSAGYNYDDHALVIESSDVSLNHCWIHDNKISANGGALFLTRMGLSPRIANTVIENNSGRAVAQATIDMTPAYANLILSGNDTDAVVISDGSLRRAVTLDGQQINGSPFIGLDQINIWDGAHLTLAPGTELRMSPSEAIYVEDGGILTAEGIPAQRVIITAVDPDRPWMKIHTLPGSTTSLSYCNIGHAGASSMPALAIYEPDLTLGRCVVHDNLTSGMRLYAGAGGPTLDNLVLIDNRLDGLRVESGVTPTLRHATIARNGDDGIHVNNGASAILTNSIIAGNDIGVHVVSDGSATLSHTLWDANGQDFDGVATETGRVDGPAAFGSDGYHLTGDSAALQQATDVGVLYDIDGEDRPQPPGTSPDIGADEFGGALPLRSWDKEIDGLPWEPDFHQTVQISDVIEIVDVIQAEDGASFTLTEHWNAEELTLDGYEVAPSGTGDVIIGSGLLTWDLGTGHPQTMTLTKQFRVEPGPWTEMTLSENLTGFDVPNPSRTVTFERLPIHDIAVVGVSPGGTLAVGEAVAVRAELSNAGTETETGVPVQCVIKGPGTTQVYDQSVVSGEIQPAAYALLEFPAWTPDAAGTYTLTCQSRLPADANPGNDAYTRVITVAALSDGGADVWTKDNATDTGDVPTQHPWWVSPDIWVRHQPDGGLVHQNPIVAVDNTVYVRIRNRGQRAASGEVAVYWSRSRIGWPCKVGAPNVGIIPFEDLQPGEVRIISTPWAPQEPGRHGLHTVIDAEGDPAGGNALCSPHWPRWDNNVSWRNTIAYFRTPGGKTMALALAEEQVGLVNVYDWPQDVDLVIERPEFPLDGTITLRLPDELFDRWQANPGHWSDGVTVLPASREILVSDPVAGIVGGIPMAASEEAIATLQFNAPETGEFQVELYEMIDGLTIGGLVYEWLVADLDPPQILAHSPLAEAKNVPRDAPVVITFDEEIGPLTLDLNLTPELVGWQASWNDTGTVVTVTHPGFAPSTEYVAEVTASDASANPMDSPVFWSFITGEGFGEVIFKDGFED